MTFVNLLRAWIVKCSMAVGVVLALAACSGDYEGDPRSGSEMLTMYAMREDEQATNEASLDIGEEILNDQATRAAKWYAQHPQG
jgi:hypothetical protein